MFLFKRNKKLLERLEEYLKVNREAMEEFAKGLTHVMNKGLDEHFEILARQTHTNESNADDIRRKIEHEMYEKSLLPESRQDLLEIIEMLDRIPNQAESILNTLLNQQTPLVDFIKPDMKELLDISIQNVDFTIAATKDCFQSGGKIKDLSRHIDNNESVGDRLERKMIKLIFANKELDAGEKLIQKELIMEIGHICDLCEMVKDKLVITSIKRSI